jgi:group II intron reverse transcriptase/maturase
VHLNDNFSTEQELFEKLDFVYQKSKQNAGFNGILEIAFHEVTIITAIHNIKANHGSKTPGLDGETIDDYLQMSKEDLIKKIQAIVLCYVPQPVKRVYIKKTNGKLRPLGIPSILDRIIQECIRIVIEPILEARFYPHSYGFRPYRACKHAIRNIMNVINSPTKQKATYAIEGDIKAYFDNVNHRKLLGKLWKMGIKDKRILAIIKEMLKAGYFELEFFQTDKGTPQGGILSPLLANVYLNAFDWMIGRMYQEPRERKCKTVNKDRERLARNGEQPKYLTRYADDWIITTTTDQEAKRLLTRLERYFKHKLKLELSKEKTVITNMNDNPVRFLGFELRMERPRTTPERKDIKNVVCKPYPEREKVKRFRDLIGDQIAKLLLLPTEEKRVEQINKINQKIVGAAEYWKTSICKNVFDKIDYHVNYSAYKVFRKIYEKDYKSHKVELNRLSNYPYRHANRNSKTFAIRIGEKQKLVGITLASITPSQWERKPYNQRMTPYTPEGRLLYKFTLKGGKSLPHYRPTVEPLIQESTHITDNLEFHMNKAYALNRDRSKCRVCGEILIPGKRQCHVIVPSLPINKVNKVNNLAWVCNKCNNYIHGKATTKGLKSKHKQKIENFRLKMEPISVS